MVKIVETVSKLNITDKDLANIRYLILDNGNKIILERKDPYGFWYARYEHGNLPEYMTQAWTSFEYAMKDIEGYLVNVTENTPSPRIEKVKLTPRIPQDSLFEKK